MFIQDEECGLLTCGDAYVLLYNVGSKIFNHFKFYLEDEMSVTQGITHSSDREAEYVKVGIKEIPRTGNDANVPVAAYDFMSCLVALYHEHQHVFQQQHMFYENTEIGRSFVMNFYATLENDDYYHRNYWNNPREVDAQYAGMVGAYQYCMGMFGQDEAERLLCHYVNTRVENNSEFIDKKKDAPYNSSSEIFSAMDVAFEKAQHVQRVYDFNMASKNTANN